MRKRKVTLAAALATALLVGGVAYAATEMGNVVQSDGQIYACYGTDLTMHVQENKADTSYLNCPTGQKLMTWNQRGLRGPTGPQGAQGAPGPAYFVKVLNTDNATSKPARITIRSWSYSDGTVWLNVPDRDVRQCAVTATPVTSGASGVTVRVAVDYANWVLLYTYVNGSRAQSPVDVMLACSY